MSSELGLQKTHSVSGPHEQLRQVPERYFCTEIKSNLSANAAGRTEYGKFCDMMARQTRSGAAPSRTTCVKDSLGNVVPITEYGAAYMELMLASSNQETRRDCVHTFAAVVSRCFSGAVDSVSVRESEDASAVDMGVSSKFTNQPVDQAVHNGSGWLFLAAMAVAQVVASQQMRGLLAVTPTIMDRAIMEALYDIVQHPAHTPYIAPESGCVSQWSREKEKVESTLPALGLLLHATQAFLRYRDHATGLASMKFSEFVHDCTVNWLAAPVPPELFPELHTRLLNSTLDWCFWLLLGIFVDFFEVPALDLNSLEAFFDNAEHSLPRADAERCMTWLRKMGTPLEVKADADPGPVRLSGRYITTPMGPDGHEDTNSLLTCNVSTTQRNEDVPELRRACDRLASRLHAKYGTRLKNSCNIHNAAALSVMLQRYMNVGMPKDRFGSLCTDGKRGWESWPALYRACSDAGPDTSVLDGHDASVAAAVKLAPNLLYAVPAVVCEQESPSLYRFGFEGRFLLWAAAIFAGANPISQPTLQRVAVHWTCRAFQHRVPVSVYPYSCVFGSVPSVEQDGFTVAPLQDPTRRPRTMVRSLPRSAVEEQNARMLQAVVEGCMPEDYACIDGQERLARMVGCGQHTPLDYREMVVPELTLTALPEDRWVPLVGYKEGEAFALAAYRNSTTRLVHGLRLDTALVCGDDGREHLPEDRAAAVVEDHEPSATLAAVFSGLVLSLRPHFARPGVVVQHEGQLGVLVPWNTSECPRGRDSAPYFNAHRMQYRLERGHGPPVCVDGDAVETGLVKVGAELLLRLDVGEVAAKLEGKHRALQSADRFHAKFERGKHAKAVLPVMLLYELPVSSEAQIGQGVWVGARARRRGIATNTYTALFLEVDVGMLCTPQDEEDAMGDVRRFELVG